MGEQPLQKKKKIGSSGVTEFSNLKRLQTFDRLCLKIYMPKYENIFICILLP